MLKRDRIFIFLFLWLFYVSCTNESKERKIVKIDYSKDPLREYQNNNFSKYKSIYESCLDSLKAWKMDTLGIAHTIIFYPYELDSTLCFNSDSNRFVTTVNIRNTIFKDKPTDLIQEFGGARINNRWYFFFLGSTMAVLREVYKDTDSIFIPLTFKELSFIAHINFTKHALIFNEKGEYAPNENFFENKFNNQDNPENKGKQIVDHDREILENVSRKYRYKMDKSDIQEFKQKTNSDSI